MLKAIAKMDDKDVLILGLSFGNLNKFLAEPGDTFIKIDGKEIGISMDIIIFSGKTEADLAESMKESIGPNTKINIDPVTKWR
jgi:hypothetical protein